MKIDKNISYMKASHTIFCEKQIILFNDNIRKLI